MLKMVFSLVFFVQLGVSWLWPDGASASLATVGGIRATSAAAAPATPAAAPDAASDSFALPYRLQVALPAAALSAEDEKNVRLVVQGQLDALARDDAVAAFSFAAPNVRHAFVTAPRFFDMVQRGYPVVIRPASMAFLKVEGKGRLAFQRVQMTDQTGMPWLATYSLAQQKNGAWRITGCSVLESRSRMT